MSPTSRKTSRLLSMPPRKKKKRAVLPKKKHWISSGINSLVGTVQTESSHIDGSLPLTEPSLIALVSCHERFLDTAMEKISERIHVSSADSEYKRARVQEDDIGEVMNTMGLSHLIAEAQVSLDRQIEENTKERKRKSNKKKNMTSHAAMLEQDRLLAQSKARAESEPP